MNSIEATLTMAEPGYGELLPELDEDACDSLEVTFEEHAGSGDCQLVKVRGQLDASNASCFQASMMKAIDSGRHDLILVFYSAQRISRETAGILRQIRKAARDRGVHIWSMSSRGT